MLTVTLHIAPLQMDFSLQPVSSGLVWFFFLLLLLFGFLEGERTGSIHLFKCEVS